MELVHRIFIRTNHAGVEIDRRIGANEGHFGLLGIQERLEEFNGSMKIASQSGKGTKISVYMHVGKPDYER